MSAPSANTPLPTFSNQASPRPAVLPSPATDVCLHCHGQLQTVLPCVFDTRFGIPDAYAVARCRHCGLEHLAPRPRPQTLDRLYRDHYNFRGLETASYSSWRERFLASAGYRLWLALDGDISFHVRPGCGRLLDVGCNEGRGLGFYRRSGFEAEGLELNAHAAAAARARGFTVSTEPIQSFQPALPYAVVVLSNVLEHALDPARMLADVGRLLQPGGEVWISCPNSQSLLRRWFGRAWVNWHVPFHIVHFSPAILRAMLVEQGFEVLQLRYQTPALWVAASCLIRLFARPGRPTRALRSTILVAGFTALARLALFPIWWAANRCGRGDCLVAVARRA